LRDQALSRLRGSDRARPECEKSESEAFLPRAYRVADRRPSDAELYRRLPEASPIGDRGERRQDGKGLAHHWSGRPGTSQAVTVNGGMTVP